MKCTKHRLEVGPQAEVAPGESLTALAQRLLALMALISALRTRFPEVLGLSHGRRFRRKTPSPGSEAGTGDLWSQGRTDVGTLVAGGLTIRTHAQPARLPRFACEAAKRFSSSSSATRSHLLV